jgi:hypothetical protein
MAKAQDQGDSIREFRAGPRPYVTAVLIALSLLGATVAIEGGLSNLSFDSLVFVTVVLVILMAAAAWTKVAVSTDSLAFRQSFWFTRRIQFRDISHSHLTRLGSKPMNLYVFGGGAMTAKFTIQLRAYSADDVAWLLSLPELRLTENKA